MTGRRRTLGVLAVVVAALAVAGAVAPVAANPTHQTQQSGATLQSASASSPTYVQSDVTRNTTWTATQGPYYVTTDVSIRDGATLTVEPGTTVYLAEEVTLTVRGSLDASGQSGAPVRFTTAEPAPEPGAWETIEYAGDAESTLRLDHAVVEYGTTGVTATTAAGRIEVSDTTVREHVAAGLRFRNPNGAPALSVTDSRFEAIGDAGLSFAADATDPFLSTAGDVTITGTSFRDTGAYGVRVRARKISAVTLDGVSVAGVSAAGVAFETELPTARHEGTNTHVVSDAVVRGTTIRAVGGPGVRFRGGALRDVAVTDSAVRNANGSGVAVSDVVDADRVRVTGTRVTRSQAGLTVAMERPPGSVRDVSLVVDRNTFADNDGFGVDVSLGYVIVDEFAVTNNTVAGNGAGGVTASTNVFEGAIVADNVVRGNRGPGVRLSGGRVADLSVTRNRFTGNLGDGASIGAAGVLADVTVTRNVALDNARYGLSVSHADAGSGRLLVANNTVAANGDGVRVAGPTTTRLANNTVAFNTAGREPSGSAAASASATGLVVESASADVTLAGNDVYGHLIGLRGAANGTVAAAHNYWGARSGPYHATINPDGAGNAIVTDRGKVDPIPFAREPFGPRLERPRAALTANRTSVAVNESVRFSAADSTDDGPITAYHFDVDGGTATRGTPTYVRSFDSPGTYTVSLVVTDAMGVESLNTATVNVTVGDAPATTSDGNDGGTSSPNTSTAPAEGGAPTTGGDEPSLLSSLFSLPGLVGGALYALALGLGGYGMVLSMRGRAPPIGGMTIHAFAALGVAAWAVGGVFADGTLLTVAGAGGVAWGALTGAAFVLATR